MLSNRVYQNVCIGRGSVACFVGKEFISMV